MKKLLIALASAGAVLGAGAASAQPYHNNWDHHDRAWHDHGWHDRGAHRGWRPFARAWRGDRYAYNREVCGWRYGQRTCWYQR